jgi:hypothetical protein
MREIERDGNVRIGFKHDCPRKRGPSPIGQILSHLSLSLSLSLSLLIGKGRDL